MNGVSHTNDCTINFTKENKNGTNCLKGAHVLLCFCDRRTPHRRQSQHIRYAFLFRCFVLIIVVVVFYVKLLVQKESGNSDFVVKEQLTEGRRRLLNFVNKSSSETELTVNCKAPSIDEFPSDGLTRAQRQSGFIIVHIIIALYCFWFLACICEEYFVPAIEQVCSTLKLQKDVVGATFMAAATSSSELFMNCVGTFVTMGDIGLGTVVGSAVFNILAVPACCGLFVGQYVPLDWWAISRDCGMYCLTVIALIAVLYDDKIMWYEALMLIIGYLFYIIVMYYNDGLARRVRKFISNFRRNGSSIQLYREVNELTPLVCTNLRSFKNNSNELPLCNQNYNNNSNTTSSMHIGEDAYFTISPWHRNNRCIFEFIFRWPITCLLWLTIPNSRKHPHWKYVTVMLAILWIGGISYLIAYVITIIGDTLDIPDSVLSLTVLSAGMSMPETVSSIIVTKSGQGGMGISNSIGSNTFDILVCLGLPWFVKAYFFSTQPDEQWIVINSVGLTYSALFLLSTLFGLYIAFIVNKFKLDWKIGIACAVMYIGFLVIASMIELNYFFPVNLPICKH